MSFGQMYFLAIVFLGKCISGQMAFWANVLGQISSGPMSFWANVLLGKCLSD
jgi:hypothetical protein